MALCKGNVCSSSGKGCIKGPVQAVPVLLIFLVSLLKIASNSSIMWNLTDGDSNPQKALVLFVTSFETEVHWVSCARTFVMEITHRNHTARTL